jgi:hypothetical protein
MSRGGESWGGGRFYGRCCWGGFCEGGWGEADCCGGRGRGLGEDGSGEAGGGGGFVGLSFSGPFCRCRSFPARPLDAETVKMLCSAPPRAIFQWYLEDWSKQPVSGGILG